MRQLHRLEPVADRGLGRIAVDDDAGVKLAVLLQGLDRAGVRQIADQEAGEDLDGLPVADRPHQRRAELGQERLFGLGGAQLLLQPLALGDVPDHRLPAAVGEDLGADLDRDEGAVLAPQLPFGHDRPAPNLLLAELREAIDVLRPAHVDDRPGQDLVARVAEHPAGSAVDVDVVTAQVGDEDGVGRLVDQAVRPRLARGQRLVTAVQGDAGHGEQQEAHDHHRRRQHRHDSCTATTPAPSIRKVTTRPRTIGTSAMGRANRRSWRPPGPVEVAIPMRPRAGRSKSRPTEMRKSPAAVGSAIPMIGIRDGRTRSSTPNRAPKSAVSAASATVRSNHSDGCDRADGRRSSARSAAATSANETAVAGAGRPG